MAGLGLSVRGWSGWTIHPNFHICPFAMASQAEPTENDMSDSNLVLFRVNHHGHGKILDKDGRRSLMVFLFQGPPHEIVGDLSLPEHFRLRIIHAIEFFRSSVGHSPHLYDFFSVSLLWAGVAIRVVNGSQKSAERVFDKVIRAPMTSALLDVFGKKEFAECIMGFCPDINVVEKGWRASSCH